jgi:hypothetical protein
MGVQFKVRNRPWTKADRNDEPCINWLMVIKIRPIRNGYSEGPHVVRALRQGGPWSPVFRYSR